MNWREILKHEIENPEKFDDDAKQVYLEHLAQHGRVTHAAQAAGITKHTVQAHRKTDPEFAIAELEAKDTYKDYVRSRVREIGIDGIKEPIMGGKYKDQKVGEKTIIAPAVTILEAKRVDPSYRERQQLDVTHKGGVLVVPAQVSIEEWEQQNQPKELNGGQASGGVQAEEGAADNEG